MSSFIHAIRSSPAVRRLFGSSDDEPPPTAASSLTETVSIGSADPGGQLGEGVAPRTPSEEARTRREVEVGSASAAALRQEVVDLRQTVTGLVAAVQAQAAAQANGTQ